MAPRQDVYTAFADTMWRARQFCVYTGFAALAAAVAVGLLALAEASMAAFTAAQYVAYVALGIASASVAMEIVLAWSDPPKHGFHRADLANDRCALLTGVVFTVSLLGLLFAALHFTATGEALFAVTLALGACVAPTVLYFTIDEST